MRNGTPTPREATAAPMRREVVAFVPLPPMPEPELHEPSEGEIEAISDALVLLAFSASSGDARIRSAAFELAKRRSMSFPDAVRIVRWALREFCDIGRKRKALDPDTQAELIGETRTRLLLLMKQMMKPENITKGGAAVALKCAEAIAELDGCSVKGMSQIVVPIQINNGGGAVQDPERVKIVEALLARRGIPSRVIDVQGDSA